MNWEKDKPMKKSSKKKKADQEEKIRELEEKIKKLEETAGGKASGGVAEGVLKGVSEIIPGLGGLMKGLEKSPAFKERLKAIDHEIERKMKEAPLRRTGDRSPHIESSFSTRTLAPEEKPSFQRKVKKAPAPPLTPKEPVVDLFDEGDYLRIITELPGVAEGDIKIGLEKETLTIRINRAGWKPEHEVALPCAPKGKLEKTFRNGFLEIKVGKEGS
jgi:HSP20 family molecular chaperone IbpA